MNAILTVLAWFVATDIVLLLLLVFFIAVMALRKLRDDGGLNGPLKFFGYQILVLGFIIDAFANCVFPVWILFVDWPYRKGESLVTARLQRYYRVEGWRGDLARFFCKEIVQKFDECHCEK